MENLLKLLINTNSSEIFKVFVEDILNGKINNNKIEKYINKINNIEKDLN